MLAANPSISGTLRPWKPTRDCFAQEGKLRPRGGEQGPATHQPGVVCPLEIPLHDPVVQADPRVFMTEAWGRGVRGVTSWAWLGPNVRKGGARGGACCDWVECEGRGLGHVIGRGERGGAGHDGRGWWGVIGTEGENWTLQEWAWLEWEVFEVGGALFGRGMMCGA
jgi:hypothetical protein